MSVTGHTLPTRISKVERVRLRNGTTLVLLTLDVTYLQAAGFTGPGVIMRVVSGAESMIVRGQLAFANPLDSLACVSVSAPGLDGVSVGDRFEFDRTGVAG